VTDTPPDWVLIEAAKRSGWDWATPSITIETYKENGPFRALCDMIAKHEQPPVDPDVEAVKRILEAYWPKMARHGTRYLEGHFLDLDRAVAQYKKEIARD